MQLSRKTTTLGALVCLGVMTNVFMINIGYDVPVKLLSFNTILMSLFLLQGDTKRLVNPPLQTDTARWKRVIISNEHYASIQLMNDSVQWYHLKIDTASKTAMVNPVSDTTDKTTFTYKKDSAGLTLTGKVKEDLISIRLKRYDEHRFRLVNRGFHWVNEFPFNR